MQSFHRADGAAAVARLLDSGDPPDAVFCFNDLLALGAQRTLHLPGSLPRLRRSTGGSGTVDHEAAPV